MFIPDKALTAMGGFGLSKEDLRDDEPEYFFALMSVQDFRVGLAALLYYADTDEHDRILHAIHRPGTEEHYTSFCEYCAQHTPHQAFKRLTSHIV